MPALAAVVVAVRTAEDFRVVLDALYTGLLLRPTTGYQWDASDAWRRALYQPDPRTTSHLEALFTFGGCTREKSHLIFDSTLMFSCRYTPDDDATSQSRLAAAADDACAYLDTFVHESQNARTCALSYTIEAPGESPAWLLVTISFQTWFYLQR